MSLIMEDFQPSVNTLEEVKKLQDLVRKLEIQNLHLRNKQNVSRKRSASPVKEGKKSQRSPTRQMKNADEKVNVDTNNFENTRRPSRDEYFDDLEIIRVSDIEMSDDESWLYTSPKSQSDNEKCESPYEWLRKDVDDPENKQLQLAKKALLTKLNELEILSPTIQITAHAQNPTVSSLRKTHVMYKTPLSAQNYDAVHIDTRTFTRSKKKQALEFLEKLNNVSNEQNSNHSELRRRSSDLSSDSISSHALEDANDVHEVARMQEESLRMNSPLGTPKRGSCNNTLERKSSVSHESTSDQDYSENSVFSAQSFDGHESEPVEDSSFEVEVLHHSDQSSPSESPYGSNSSLHSTGKGKVKLGGYRRSLPNLAREPVLQIPSKTKIVKQPRVQRTNQIREDMIGRSDINIASRQKAGGDTVSISKVKHSSKSLTAGFQQNSKPVTSVPKSANFAESRLHVRSGVPKPSRASSATRSTPRSGIPMPSMLNKKHVEDSWSDGCF
ncbi:SLAIN motif-containing protein 2-like [Uloborus diversus]|uniref:SLAIN motif-containing protein 2-like n=1 Tax=Uloborus diversus TaxID=327109 RepID=UPI0024092062|nr:SLAIN motif-containing protein 2-like [Uloborus diversus]